MTTEEEIQSLKSRVKVLEDLTSKYASAFVSVIQYKQTVIVQNQRLDELESKVEDILTRISSLEEYVNSH